jgi:hypothetical protein
MLLLAAYHTDDGMPGNLVQVLNRPCTINGQGIIGPNDVRIPAIVNPVTASHLESAAQQMEHCPIAPVWMPA